MGQRGRPTAQIVLSDDEREALQRWARRPKSAQALALRCRIVLAAAEGLTNQRIAKELGCNPVTVGKWRTRFAVKRLEGLVDEPRPGAPRTITDEIVEQVIVTTLETTPVDATHWSTRSLAAKLRLNQTAVSRIWRAFGLKPHLVDEFKVSPDPQFIDKVRDVVGLYLNPPDAAVVLCVDEKTQVQALDRTAPILPMLPGVPQRRSHDYVRNGTADLYAALDVASGQVLTKMTDQHRAVEFRAFLNLIDRTVPDGLAVHAICDNTSTPQGPRDRTVAETPPPVHVALHPDLQLVVEPGRTPVLGTDHQAAPARDQPQRQRAPPRHQRLGRAPERQPSPVHVAQDRRRDPRQPRHLTG